MAANPLVPFGFRVAAQFNASPPNFALNNRQIAYNNTNQIAYGDPVKMLNTGYIDLMANGGTTIHGILAAVDFADSTAQYNFRFQNYWNAPSNLASTTVVTAKVYNDPNTIFLAQAQGAAATISAIGLNVDIKTGTSGTPTTAGISQCALDIANAAVTSTFPFRIVGILGIGGSFSGSIAPIPNYVATNDNQFIFVKMNTSDLTQTSGI